MKCIPPLGKGSVDPFPNLGATLFIYLIFFSPSALLETWMVEQHYGMKCISSKDADLDRQTHNKTGNAQALSQKFETQAIKQLRKNSFFQIGE